jgi:hypothetical protein
MAFSWLNRFQQRAVKREGYAEKTLAAYRLGMKARGSIVGVRIDVGVDCCEMAKGLVTKKVYHPDEAPIVPLEGCNLGTACQCVYRPVMSYEGAE